MTGWVPLGWADLVACCRGLDPGDRLLRSPALGFRRIFTAGIETLGLTRFGFRPYSLRRGGATHEMRMRGSMEHVLERGRWSSTNSARIYLQDAVASAISIASSVPEQQGIDWLCGTSTSLGSVNSPLGFPAVATPAAQVPETASGPAPGEGGP